MLAEERRHSILSLIEAQGSVRTVELAKTFKVSDQTIRRDLLELEEKGLISKSHGGGVRNHYEGQAYGDRSVSRQQEKLLIAQEAVRQVRCGMTVAIGPGTTTEAIAQLINGMSLQIVTNSLPVARAISSRDTKVRLTGGEYRPDSQLLTGAWAEENLEVLFADISFIGVSGISPEDGYTVTEPDEASMLRQFIRIAKKSVVVSDSSKFHRIAEASVAPLGAVHMLITDHDLPQDDYRQLQACGVETRVVNGNSRDQS